MRCTLLALCVIMLAFPFASAEAQQKIAYVNITAIMNEIPEAQEAQRQLDMLVDRWQKELRDLEEEWQARFNDYDKRKLILTDQGRANAEKVLQELDARIMTFRDQKFGQNGELFQEEERLMRPIQDLVFDQVKGLAEEMGYDYVLDKSGGVMIIYAKDEYDLTKPAIERIRTTLPAREIPGAGSSRPDRSTTPPPRQDGRRPPTEHTTPEGVVPPPEHHHPDGTEVPDSDMRR
jgi:outer membrane protein